MPLSHFIVEAKKHTPILRPATVEAKPIIDGEAPIQAIPTEGQNTETKKFMAEISEVNKEDGKPSWQRCKYYKEKGERAFCGQYFSWCVKDQCQKKYMDANFYDFKKYLKGATIK